MFAQAVSNSYTMQLITAVLLFATDMTNQQTLTGLSESVYPLYDEIESEFGKKALKDHLGYIHSKMKDYADNKKTLLNIYACLLNNILQSINKKILFRSHLYEIILYLRRLSL